MRQPISLVRWRNKNFSSRRERERKHGAGRNGKSRPPALASGIALVIAATLFFLLRPQAENSLRSGANPPPLASSSVHSLHLPHGGRHRFRRRVRVSVVKGPARVIDGDSLVVNGVEIRLQGIDAPEYRQRCYDGNGHLYACGRKALAHLRSLVDGRVLECRRVSTDIYGRMVATCIAHGIDIGKRMVEDGWAVAFVRYSLAYVPAETIARLKRRGLWQGRFIRPAQWRRAHRRHRRQNRYQWRRHQ